MRKALGLLLALFLGGALVCGTDAVLVPHGVVAAASGASGSSEAFGATGSTGSSGATGHTGTTLSNDRHYTNSDGNRVTAPAKSSNGVPAGATARCGDGTYSFSQHHQGTCSHHGGVARWL